MVKGISVISGSDSNLKTRFRFLETGDSILGGENTGSLHQVTGTLDVDGNVSASIFYGDGSGLTNITASEIPAQGSDWEIQYNLGDDLAASANLTFVSASTLYVTGTVAIGGTLTASSLISASTYYGDGSNLTNITASEIAAAGSDYEIQLNYGGDLSASSGLIYSGSQLYVTGQTEIAGDVVPPTRFSHDLGSRPKPWNSLYVRYGSIHFMSASGVTGTVEIGTLGLSGTTLTYTGSTLFGSSTADTHTFTGSFLQTGSGATSVFTDNINVIGNLSASINISASAFYGDGSGLTNLTASSIISGAAGNDYEIQYNLSDDLAASANLTFDTSALKLTGTLDVSGSITGSSLAIGSASFINPPGQFGGHPAVSIDNDGTFTTRREGFVPDGGFKFVAYNTINAGGQQIASFHGHHGTASTSFEVFSIYRDEIRLVNANASLGAGTNGTGSFLLRAQELLPTFTLSGAVAAGYQYDLGKDINHTDTAQQYAFNSMQAATGSFRQVFVSSSLGASDAYLYVSGNVSASSFYGDGSNLTNITASEIEAAGNDYEIQYNLSDDLTASADLTFSGSTLRVTGSVNISGSISGSSLMIGSASGDPANMFYGGEPAIEITSDGTIQSRLDGVDGFKFLSLNTENSGGHNVARWYAGFNGDETEVMRLDRTGGFTGVSALYFATDPTTGANKDVRIFGSEDATAKGLSPYHDALLGTRHSMLGRSDTRWLEIHGLTGSYSILSASVAMSASTYYGDGSQLTNITASEIEAAGDTNDVQYNLNDDLTGSNNFTFDGTTLNVLTTASMGKIFAGNSIADPIQKPVFSSGDYYTYYNSYGAAVLNTPWVNNVLFLANQRFTLDVEGTPQVPTLFNNIYNEGGVLIPSGTGMRVFDLDLTASQVLADGGVTYPKGFFVAHFLGGGNGLEDAENINVYFTYSGSSDVHHIPTSDVENIAYNTNNHKNHWRINLTASTPYLDRIILDVTGGTTSVPGGNAVLTEFEYYQERVGGQTGLIFSGFNMYRENYIYKNTNWIDTNNEETIVISPTAGTISASSHITTAQNFKQMATTNANDFYANSNFHRNVTLGDDAYSPTPGTIAVFAECVGDWRPNSTEAYNLGRTPTSGMGGGFRRWNNLYLKGTAEMSYLSASTGAQITGTLDVLGSVSASLNISASSFYGDGSNLTSVTASEIEAAGNDYEIQYNLSDDLTASADLTFSGSTLRVTGSAYTTEAVLSPSMYITGTITEADALNQTILCNGPDTQNTLAVDVVGEKIYFAGNDARIHTCPLGGGTSTVLKVVPQDVMGIALDVDAGKMYYTMRLSGISSWIYRADMADGTNEELLYSGTGEPYGIALDIAENRMYYVENDSRDIYRASMNGTASFLQHLVSTTNDPISIALDIASGTMYWTEGGTGDDIMSAPMAGTGSEAAQNVYSSYPYDGPWTIDVDPYAQKIYMSENGTAATRGIYWLNYDGTGFDHLLFNAGPSDVQVVPELGRVYWTYYHDGEVRSFEIPQNAFRLDTQTSKSLIYAARDTVSVKGAVNISGSLTSSVGLHVSSSTGVATTSSFGVIDGNIGPGGNEVHFNNVVKFNGSSVHIGDSTQTDAVYINARIGSPGLIPNSDGDNDIVGTPILRWKEVHGVTGSYSILSASNFVSASTYYGDGSNLTNITASEIEAAGNDYQVQYNLNDDLTASADLTFSGSTLRVTGSVNISGSLTSSVGLHVSSSTGVATTSSFGVIEGNVGAGANELNLDGTVRMSGPFIYLGDASSDSVYFNARVGSSINPNSDGNNDNLGASTFRWKESHIVTGSFSIVSASVAVSASTYYGDGSNLTNITASEIEAAGDTNDIQYNSGDDLTGSNNLTFDNTTLQLTGAATISGDVEIGNTINVTTHISGALTINNHEFKVLNASSTKEVFLVTGSTVSAGENSPNLGATLNVGNNNSITADATLQWSLGGTQKMIMGLDNSNQDKFTFCAGASADALSDVNNVYTINSNGLMAFGQNGVLTLGEADESDDVTSIDARLSNFIVLGFARVPVAYVVTSIHHVALGQIIVCQHDPANATATTITFQTGTDLFLLGGADFVSRSGDTITFMCTKDAAGDPKLYEIARTVM